MKRLVPILVGACIGFVFSTIGFIELYPTPRFGYGGNENTPFVIAGGVLLGAVVGATEWARRHAAIPIGAFLGLIAWILFRDYVSWVPGLSQPSAPIIIGALFLAVVGGAALGWMIEQRSNEQRRG